MISYQGQSFLLKEVKEKDNCFFRAAIESNVFKENSPDALRQKLYDSILRMLDTEQRCQVTRIYDSFAESETLESYITRQRNSGMWSSSLEVVFMSFVWGVNIRCVANGKGGFFEFNSDSYLQLIGLGPVTTRQTVWLYNHLYEHPFRSTENLNHFSCLTPSVSTDHNMEVECYRGAAIATRTQTELQ